MTVLFIHAVGLDAGCWQFLDRSGLGDTTAYTLLGHGDRERPDTVTMESFADDIADNTSGQLDIVGLSLGGSVAQHVALRHPGRVRSLLVAASAAGGPRRPVHEQRAREVEKRGMAGVVDSMLQRWFTPGTLALPHHAGLDYARNRLLADDPKSVAATWRALARHDTTGRLAELQLPVTVLHAAEDTAGALEPKAQFARSLPLGRIAVIPGPHMVPIENPSGFRIALLEHFAWVDSLTPDAGRKIAEL